MTFWALIILAALLVTVFLGYSMTRGQKTREPAAAYDLRVYREGGEMIEQAVIGGDA